MNFLVVNIGAMSILRIAGVSLGMYVYHAEQVLFIPMGPYTGYVDM